MAGPRENAALIRQFYDEAVKDSCMVISMKNDWKRIFSFEE